MNIILAKLLYTIGDGFEWVSERLFRLAESIHHVKSRLRDRGIYLEYRMPEYRKGDR